MKKILAIVLAMLMVASLFACGGTSTPSASPSESVAPSASTAPASESPSAEPTSNAATGEIGMFDPNYDYSANQKYKVQYVVLATSILYEMFNAAFEHWATQMNIEYLGMQEYGGDKDAYLSNLPTLANNVDGLLVDPDSQQYTRVAEVLNENGTPWMGCMAAPRNYEDPAMPLIHPFVGFDNYVVGTIMPAKLLEFKDELWPDVPLEEFGFITVDYSTAFPLHQREQGFKDTLTALHPEVMENYFVADTAINMFDLDTSKQVVSAVLSQNPDIEYWLIWAEIDNMAQGAAVAIDTVGLTDNSAIVTFGGTALQMQWDAGNEDAWRAACYLPQTIYAEPIIGALYAFMSGQATAEDIWPNWVNVNDKGGADANYASRLLPYYWIEKDNYKQMIKWSDIYAGSNYYPDYPADGITRDTFSTSVPVPESYKTPKA